MIYLVTEYASGGEIFGKGACSLSFLCFDVSDVKERSMRVKDVKSPGPGLKCGT